MEKTLLLKLSDESEKKVVLPEGARFTFGPAIPFVRKGGGYPDRQEYAVRIYSDKTNDSLLAVFTGVCEVRDLSIAVHKKLLKESGRTLWHSDETGLEVSQSVSREERWEEDNTPRLTTGRKKK